LKKSRYKPIAQPKGDLVFSAPWHCELFALTISLYEKNVFDWEHWTSELGKKLKDKPASAADDLDYYYSSWLETLEELVLQKEVIFLDDIKREVSTQMKHLQDNHH
tara:strand:+ start:463 stop:780 length:318 start_codon:yes stop_codon:yes gene_type:complete